MGCSCRWKKLRWDDGVYSAGVYFLTNSSALTPCSVLTRLILDDKVEPANEPVGRSTAANGKAGKRLRCNELFEGCGVIRGVFVFEFPDLVPCACG